MSIKRTMKLMVAGPSFIVLAGSTAGAALAPSMNQSPIVGAFVGGMAVLLVLAIV